MLNEIIIGVAIIIVAAFLIWVGNGIWLRSIRPTVLAHKAYFAGDTKEFYFIKVQNRSLINKSFTITHLWAIDGLKEVHITNPARPLPAKIGPTDVWEAWIQKSEIENHMDIFDNFRIKLSNDRIVKSKENKKVPSRGFVAGA